MAGRSEVAFPGIGKNGALLEENPRSRPGGEGFCSGSRLPRKRRRTNLSAMGSWRDQTSEEAQQDLDSLVGMALEKGESTLEETGELRPFFVGVRADGKKTMGSVGDEVDASEVVVRLVAALRKSRDQYRAVAVVKDVTLRDGSSDAIWVDLCHREGAAMTCYLPYRLEDGRLTAGSMGAQACDNLLW